MAEHGLDGAHPVIGVAFDGTGYGDDEAVWGGEILLADYDGYRRFGQLAYVPLPGGDTTVRRPYRMALAHLRAAGIDWAADLPRVAACPPEERRLLARQLERHLNCVPDLQHGPALRRRLLTGRGLPPGRIRGPGRRRTRSRGPDRGRGPRARLCVRAACRTDRARRAADTVADPAPVLAAVVADVRAGTARR